MNPNEQVVPFDPSLTMSDLSQIHDIPTTVSIEVGRLKISAREFLRLVPGYVIELKKPAGEPFEIAINGCLVARGEVIMVEQSSGVRIVEVLKPVGGA